MEKYLKIHWSIRFTLGIIQFFLLVTICVAVYSIVYYSEIQNTLKILDVAWYGTKQSLNILYPIGNLLIGICNLLIGISGIFIIYKLFQYKRWAIMLTIIFIGLPLSVFFVGLFGLMQYLIYETGIGPIEIGKVFLFIVYELILLLFSILFVLFSFRLIQLYKNIKNIEHIDVVLLRKSKPRFINFLFVSISPFILIGYFMVSLYNPVVPIEIPDGYFKIEGFDLDNPTYTNPEICKKLFDGINLLDEKVRTVGKEDVSSGVILGKKAIFSQSDMTIKFLNLKGKGVGDTILKKSMTEIQKERPEEYKIITQKQKEEEQKRTELKEYIENHPDQWKKDIVTLRSQLTNESIIKLQELTDSLPQEINCHTRNDSNLISEFYPSLVKYLKLSRIYDAAIRLAIIENDKEKAIDILRSFHDFNTKYYSLNTSLGKGMISNRMIIFEFGSLESLVNAGGKEEIAKIREIYKTRFNTQVNRLKAWKGEYYFLEHILTGRGKSIKELSIPYLFNGEDMLNRGTILVYASVIADIKNDTIMKQEIHENQIINKNNFLTPTEQLFLEEGVSSGINNNIFFGKFYNPIGKILLDALMPSFGGYNQRYRDFDIYQDYIRHDLLGIEDEIK